jgi:hypothetical protein
MYVCPQKLKTEIGEKKLFEMIAKSQGSFFLIRFCMVYIEKKETKAYYFFGSDGKEHDFLPAHPWIDSRRVFFFFHYFTISLFLPKKERKKEERRKERKKSKKARKQEARRKQERKRKKKKSMYS